MTNISFSPSPVDRSVNVARLSSTPQQSGGRPLGQQVVDAHSSTGTFQNGVPAKPPRHHENAEKVDAQAWIKMLSPLTPDDLAKINQNGLPLAASQTNRSTEVNGAVDHHDKTDGLDVAPADTSVNVARLSSTLQQSGGRPLGQQVVDAHSSTGTFQNGVPAKPPRHHANAEKVDAQAWIKMLSPLTPDDLAKINQNGLPLAASQTNRSTEVNGAVDHHDKTDGLDVAGFKRQDQKASVGQLAGNDRSGMSRSGDDRADGGPRATDPLPGNVLQSPTFVPLSITLPVIPQPGSILLGSASPPGMTRANSPTPANPIGWRPLNQGISRKLNLPGDSESIKQRAQQFEPRGARTGEGFTSGTHNVSRTIRANMIAERAVQYNKFGIGVHEQIKSVNNLGSWTNGRNDVGTSQRPVLSERTREALPPSNGAHVGSLIHTDGERVGLTAQPKLSERTRGALVSGKFVGGGVTSDQYASSTTRPFQARPASNVDPRKFTT